MKIGLAATRLMFRSETVSQEGFPDGPVSSRPSIRSKSSAASARAASRPSGAKSASSARASGPGSAGISARLRLWLSRPSSKRFSVSDSLPMRSRAFSTGLRLKKSSTSTRSPPRSACEPPLQQK